LIFALYIFFILVFAGLYQWIHSKYKLSFKFDPEILGSESQLVQTYVRGEIVQLLYQLDLLRTLLDQFQEVQKVVPYERDLLREGIAITKKYKYQVELLTEKTGIPPLEDDRLITSLSVEEIDGTRVANFTRDGHPSDGLPNTLAKFQQTVTLFISDLETILTDRKMRLRNVTADPAEVLSFLDLLYFSTITQTTVGYGEILPNSSRVRLAVVLQILLGLLTIGVAINFVF
jgi:hypothetical protein